MTDHNHTWARLVERAHVIYPDDPDLATLHAREAFEEEHTAAYDRQAEQLEEEVARAEEEGRAYVLTLQRAGTAAAIADVQAELAVARADLAAARAEIAAARADLARGPAPL